MDRGAVFYNIRPGDKIQFSEDDSEDFYNQKDNGFVTINRNKNFLGEIFPPDGTVDFLKVTPNNIFANNIQTVQSVVRWLNR